MIRQTNNNQENVVKDLRKIRDQINIEIKDMTFAEERAYLDKLLAVKKNVRTDKRKSVRSGQTN